MAVGMDAGGYEKEPQCFPLAKDVPECKRVVRGEIIPCEFFKDNVA
jgi:hypothetical protein